jgi:hypothetical protein
MQFSVTTKVIEIFLPGDLAFCHAGASFVNGQACAADAAGPAIRRLTTLK